MPPQTKYAVPPQDAGLRVFVRAAYPAKYNFAVANYNAVSVTHKQTMRGGRLLLFRSVVAVTWIISILFGVLVVFSKSLLAVTIICSLIYIALSIYNAYIFFSNHNVLNATRLLPAKFAGPSGRDYEWVPVPVDSRSANERLAAVEQASLDNVRKEFTGTDKSEIDCMVYTKRYADTYPSFPKELLIHIIAFLIAMIIGIAIATAI